MKVNFNKFFETFDHKNTGEKISDVVAQALYNYGSARQVDVKQKYSAYKLSCRIMNETGAVEITTEEATLIKDVCGECLTSGGYGQVYDLIENR